MKEDLVSTIDIRGHPDIAHIIVRKSNHLASTQADDGEVYELDTRNPEHMRKFRERLAVCSS